MNGKTSLTGAELLARAEALHDIGRHAEAESAVLDVLTTSGASATIYRLLARIERALVRPRSEARALEQALAMHAAGATGDSAQLWTRLAALRAWQGDLRGSLEAYERAVLVQPAHFAAHEGLARTRFALQDLHGARRSVAELERLFPEAAFTHLFAGHVHKALGDPLAASDLYARALRRDPELGEALYNLVDLKIPSADDELAVQAAAMASRADLAVADRINAGFALARILDRDGHYRDAFEQLRRANDLARAELTRRGITYTAADVEARVDCAIAEYLTSSFQSTLEPLPIELNPVFVIGLPRSGTTLIEQILASHSQVQAGGELPFAHECAQLFRQRRGAAGRDGAIDPADPVDAELIESARERYLDALFEHGLDGPWIVDKLPANFEIAGFLRLMFPDAPIVHSARDPRANCFSLYRANFGAHEPWYHDLAHLAHYYGQYRRLMAHWSRVIPAPCIEVVYEDLVRGPEAQIAALLDTIGLAFEPGCVEFHRHRRPILTASHAQVRKPIYTTAVDHWQRYAECLGPLVSLRLH